MGGSKKGAAHKMSLTVRTILEERGIDLVDMQLEVYRKAMQAFDSHRGDTEKSDAGPAYLAICNQAIGTMAKYAFPTMTAIKLEDADRAVNDKVIDAVKVRETILNDPFANAAAAKALSNTDTGLPVLVGGKKEE